MSPLTERDWLASRFEQHRPRVRAVAYRMLGSPSAADDTVQESRLRPRLMTVPVGISSRSAVSVLGRHSSSASGTASRNRRGIESIAWVSSASIK
jgi:Sigma-70 region 2